MVNDLSDLLRENVAAPPPERFDPADLVAAGRARVRRRRVRAGLGAGAAVLAVAGVTGAASLGWTVRDDAGPQPASAGVPAPDAPTITLADATAAEEGRDYRTLTTHTNADLEADNGQSYDGVTDDGLVLFRDGPRADQQRPVYSLVDPATGEAEELPDPGLGSSTARAVELGVDQLVLVTTDDLDAQGAGALTARVLDRTTQVWRTVTWPALPRLEFPDGQVGPDGRLYVKVPDRSGAVPEGGWPTGNGGEADDSGAEGDTYRLWSVSLSDGADVRDEGLSVGSVAFTDGAMVWSDSTNGAAGQLHVRDLATGAESSFDPRMGERCNLLGFGASGDHVVMSEYCGDYGGDERDDRVQVVTTDGEQVVTVQDSGVEGSLAGHDTDLVTLTGYEGDGAGTYVYDLATGRFLRLSDGVSPYGGSGPGLGDLFTWTTPTEDGRGNVLHLGELAR